MNNQPRPNSEQETQQQIDQTIELLESLGNAQPQHALDIDQRAIVEVASAARASVSAHLPGSNQALRRQLIEALDNGPTAVSAQPAVRTFPIKRWATAAALMVGLGFTGWYLSEFDTANLSPSGVAFKEVSEEPKVKLQEVETVNKKPSVVDEAATAFLSDDLLDVAKSSDGESFSRPSVQLPDHPFARPSTVVTVPDGGTVVMGGIKQNEKISSNSLVDKTSDGKQIAQRGDRRNWIAIQLGSDNQSNSSPTSPVNPAAPETLRQKAEHSADDNFKSSIVKENDELALGWGVFNGRKRFEARREQGADSYERNSIVQTPKSVRFRTELDSLTAAKFLSGGEILTSRLSEEAISEGYVPIAENAFIGATGSDAVSTFSIDVDTASYANTRRFLRLGQLPPPDAVRIEELINYFPYSYAPPTGEDPFSVDLELADCPWQPKHKLVRVGIKGKEVDVAERKPTHLVFLLDVSGSMNSADKLPLLKRGFKMMVDQLNENDRVTIVTYAGQAGLALETTSGDQKSNIKQAIDVLTPGGSTHGSAGIELAYQLAQQNFINDGNNKVILATDGDLNVGITADKPLVDLIKQKASEGVFLTVLGFGTGNLQDGKMEQLADNGNGMYCYIDSVREARKVLVQQMTGALVTIAKDVKIQVEFNPQEVHSYRLIGYENRLLAAADFNNDRKDAGEIGAGHTVTAIYEIVTSEQADAASVSSMALKYQSNDTPKSSQPRVSTGSNLTDAAESGELLTLAMRYKQPDSNTSKRIEFTIANEAQRFDKASADFRFTASVAAYGMLLRNSEYAGNTTAAMIEEIAAGSMGPDVEGYRAEFIDLVRKAKTLLKR